MNCGRVEIGNGNESTACSPLFSLCVFVCISVAGLVAEARPAVLCSVIFCYFVSSRPGRPPKRSPLMGITSPQHDVLMKMKKPRLDNGDYLPYENGHGAAGES